jgi:hypothetical protein
MPEDAGIGTNGGNVPPPVPGLRIVTGIIEAIM